jgi:hypothetical protein
MNREIRKLNKKIDELEKLVNHNSDCIMEQSIIIHKLIEKLVGHSPYLDERFTGPLKPKEPYINPTPYNYNVTCPHCGKNTGIPMLLHMVIPPEGLKCPWCNKTAVYSNSPTCQVTPIRDEDNICGGARVIREATPASNTAYDGTLNTLPANTIIGKWTASEVNDFMKGNKDNL